MATPSEKLAESLEALKLLQEAGVVAIQASALTRTHRQRLLTNGFITEVYKGWYLTVPPDSVQGDSTAWYSSYWEFSAQLLENRFGKNWCISPEHSLLIHGGNSVVPEQLIVRSPAANNSVTPLPFHTSLFLLRTELPAKTEMTMKEGIRLFTLAASLVRVAPNTFTRHPTDTRTALSLIRDASEILNLLLDGGHSAIGGRLAGAFRNIHYDRIADDILKTMEKAGYDIRETDPFDSSIEIRLSGRTHSPYGNRIRLMWQTMRDEVIPHFPAAPGLPKKSSAYLKDVEKIYVTDAYHSLSIEKYKVTPELIEKVRKGTWNAGGNEEDREQRNAMAAKGYWESFQAVEQSIKKILEGENAGDLVDADHGDWYRALFSPGVTAGILKPSELAGYRNHAVYISGSAHTPLNKEAVRDAMPVLFELLRDEPQASVRATLGHFLFVFIHPYMDGNGRMGRFLMNAMMASGGYPWTVIPVDLRKEYMHALEEASARQNIVPFAKLLGGLVKKTMEGKPVAKI